MTPEPFEWKDVFGWIVGLFAVIAGLLKWLFIQHDKALTEKIDNLHKITEEMRKDIHNLQLEMLRSHTVFLNKSEFLTWKHEVKELIDTYNSDQKETLKRIFQLIEKIDDKKADK